ncbi:MAG: transglycosylase SLT domain-containing protein [Bacteriovoracaceae bacterium]|nr:transglycosylase SLT domain-containing protein [Bacteriovoracaceae bacterium]
MNISAQALDAILDGDTIIMQDLIFENEIAPELTEAKSALSRKVVDGVLRDEKDLVHADFEIPDYFRPNVTFWFSVYTQYSSHQVLIHDKNNLDIVYEALDFSDLEQKKVVDEFTRYKRQDELAMARVLDIKARLMELSHNISPSDEKTKKVLNIVSASSKIPDDEDDRIKFFTELSLNIRTQTGQREMIHQGVKNSFAFTPFMKEHFKNFELPTELMAIPFLESSFNNMAKSRVNAAGAWQIMPNIATNLMPYESGVLDTRYNMPISTLAAFHLLKEDFQRLKRWDLTVTAYNSGAKHLFEAKKQLGDKYEHSLENIFIHYEAEHHGFASKNFYSEFLALVHVLAYKESIFPIKDEKNYPLSKAANKINIYVCKCPLTASKFFKIHSKEIKNLNPQFLQLNKRHDFGALIASKEVLPKEYYHQLTHEQLRRKWPINWKNQTKKAIKCP